LETLQTQVDMKTLLCYDVDTL